MLDEDLIHLLKGPKAWNEYRKEGKWSRYEFDYKDLGQANLSGANLQDCSLFHSNLQEADLKGANLQQADLKGANLQQADLRGANLQQADLRGANLQQADLRGANLQQADLEGANLEGANLTQADLTEAIELKPSQIKSAINWGKAFYVPEILDSLGLPPDHNEKLRKKFLEKLPEE